MKNQKLPIWILFTLNIFLLSILIYGRVYWCTNSVDNESYNRAVLSLKLLYQNQKQISAYQVFTNGMELQRKLELQTEHGEIIQMGSIISGPALVLRYSELNCQSCLDLILEELMTFSTFNEENILLLAYYKEPSYLYQFKRMNRLQYPVFSIKNTGLPPDTLNVPYLFLLDQSLKVSNVFIPEEGDIASLTQFLSFASQKLDKHR